MTLTHQIFICCINSRVEAIDLEVGLDKYATRQGHEGLKQMESTPGDIQSKSVIGEKRS